MEPEKDITARVLDKLNKNQGTVKPLQQNQKILEEIRNTLLNQ